jgi:hypothetical protein
MLLSQQKRINSRMCYTAEMKDGGGVVDALSMHGECHFHEDDDSNSESTAQCHVEDGDLEKLDLELYNLVFPKSTLGKSLSFRSSEKLSLDTRKTEKDLLIIPSLESPTLPSASADRIESTPATPPRRTTQPSIASPRALKSAFSNSPNKKKGRSSIRGTLRVRGLWDEDTANPFSNVHTDALLSIFSYCTAPELCRLSMVSSRWNFVANQDRAWKSVDATDMLQTLYKFNARANPATAAEETSVALASRLGDHALQKLTIRSIGGSLLADKFLSSAKALQELTLTGFSDLTDTHVHVMLLRVVDGQTRAKTNANNLRKLALEDCPRLTNAVVRSIALHCPNLEELSLRGCCNISDLTPLKSRWKYHEVDSQPSAQSVVAPSSLGSLFAPPVPPKPSLSSLFVPAPSKPSLGSLFDPPPEKSSSRPSTPPNMPDAGAGALAFLFAPPGTSPPGRARRAAYLSPSFTGGSSETISELCHLDVSCTSVTPSSLLQALGMSFSDRKVELRSLRMRGNGESWRDDHLTKFSELVYVAAMKTLEIDVANPCSGESYFTERGLNALLSGAGAMKLRSLLETSLRFC